LYDYGRFIFNNIDKKNIREISIGYWKSKTPGGSGTGTGSGRIVNNWIFTEIIISLKSMGDSLQVNYDKRMNDYLNSDKFISNSFQKPINTYISSSHHLITTIGVKDLIIVDTTEDGFINLPIDEFDFYKKCKTKLKKEGILIKNGDRTLNILSVSKLFKYMEIIDLADISVIGDYKFIFGSDTIDFRKTNMKNKELPKFNLKKYKYKNHKNHFLM
jgi:hypothetical protein